MVKVLISDTERYNCINFTLETSMPKYLNDTIAKIDSCIPIKEYVCKMRDQFALTGVAAFNLILSDYYRFEEVTCGKERGRSLIFASLKGLNTDQKIAVFQKIIEQIGFDGLRRSELKLLDDILPWYTTRVLDTIFCQCRQDLAASLLDMIFKYMETLRPLEYLRILSELLQCSSVVEYLGKDTIDAILKCVANTQNSSLENLFRYLDKDEDEYEEGIYE